MDIDTTRPTSRRSVLTAAIGGAAAAAAAAVVADIRTATAGCDDLVVGTENESSTVTVLTNTAENGVGLKARTSDGTALIGEDNGFGVGVLGTAGQIGVGGVSGFVAVNAYSDGGIGLRVAKGRVQIDEVTGIASIAVGADSVAVEPTVQLYPQAFVLLTPMSDIGPRGLWYTMELAEGRFVIHVSTPVEIETKVAWLMLERDPELALNET